MTSDASLPDSYAPTRQCDVHNPIILRCLSAATVQQNSASRHVPLSQGRHCVPFHIQIHTSAPFSAGPSSMPSTTCLQPIPGWGRGVRWLAASMRGSMRRLIPHTYHVIRGSVLPRLSHRLLSRTFSSFFFTPMVDPLTVGWVLSFRENNYLSVAAFTLLYYDFALTFTDEVNHFWKSASFSVFSTLFVLNRYLGLIGTIPIVVEYFADIPETSCRLLQLYHQVFSMAIQGVVASMLILRTYALYERNKAVLVLLVITFIGAAIACLAAMLLNSPAENTSSTIPVRDPPNQCDLSLTTTQAIRFSIGWGAMLWFDATVFLLTLVRALRTHNRLSGGILEVLLRDGTIYFGIMVVLNVSNIITFLAVPVGSKKGIETTLVNGLSTTLASRLFLNLRDLSSPRWHRHEDEESDVARHWSSNPAVPDMSFLVFATQPGVSTGFDATGTRGVGHPDGRDVHEA